MIIKMDQNDLAVQTMMMACPSMWWFSIGLVLAFGILIAGNQQPNNTDTIITNGTDGFNDTTPEPAPAAAAAEVRSPTWATSSRLFDWPQKVDRTEYRQFRDSLLRMHHVRNRNLIRLQDYFQRLVNNGQPGKSIAISDLSYRVYNFTTGIQFEDEFDCDLNQLAECESRLLRKIEVIEGQYVVFTVNRTEEDEVASQIDVLKVCRSMDDEFTCLINFADKCEKKMTWATFSILKYIITQNNETIVSCKQKELDWLGPQNIQYQMDQWVDRDGIVHHLGDSREPCIPSPVVGNCWTEHVPGLEFGRDATITDGHHCQQAYNFQHCIKQYLFEENVSCSLDEKEAALQIIMGSFRWNLMPHKPDIPPICQQLRLHWIREKPVLGMVEDYYWDHWDKAKRFVYVMRSDLGSNLDAKCDKKVSELSKACDERLEKRLRNIWNGQMARNNMAADHVPVVCCSISEFKKCLSVFVLLRCGKDSYRHFNVRARIARVDQCTDDLEYGTTFCAKHLNFKY